MRPAPRRVPTRSAPHTSEFGIRAAVAPTRPIERAAVATAMPGRHRRGRGLRGYCRSPQSCESPGMRVCRRGPEPGRKVGPRCGILVDRREHHPDPGLVFGAESSRSGDKGAAPIPAHTPCTPSPNYGGAGTDR